MKKCSGKFFSNGLPDQLTDSGFYCLFFLVVFCYGFRINIAYTWGMNFFINHYHFFYLSEFETGFNLHIIKHLFPP